MSSLRSVVAVNDIDSSSLSAVGSNELTINHLCITCDLMSSNTDGLYWCLMSESKHFTGSIVSVQT